MASSQGITEHDVDPPYELLLQHNASIFGKHAAGKTILVLREASACSAQALSEVAAFCAFYAVFASPSQDKLSGI